MCCHLTSLTKQSLWLSPLHSLSLLTPSDEVTLKLCCWKALPPPKSELLQWQTNVSAFLLKQCWNFQRPWWTCGRTSRCSGVLRCYCYLMWGGQSLGFGCIMRSHSPLSVFTDLVGTFWYSISVLMNQSISHRHKVWRIQGKSLFEMFCKSSSWPGRHTHSPFCWEVTLTYHSQISRLSTVHPTEQERWVEIPVRL